MKLSEYLFHRIAEAGAKTLLGIPGDFALPLFARLEAMGRRVVTFVHEPALGYAADAYARLNGFSAAVVTYGAGGLNIINAVAQAYAEKSPVLIVSGAPEILSRRRDLLVHHRVKTFESQRRIFDEVCCATAILERVDTAADEIDYVIGRILSYKRPGYIEVPRDLCDCEISVPAKPRDDTPREPAVDASVREVLDGLASRIAQAKTPVLYLGVEIRRLGLEAAIRTFVERLNLPFTTSLEGKAVIPESHPNFIGTYAGIAGSKSVKETLDLSDLILNFGTMMSDVNLGLFSGTLDPLKTVHLTAEGLSLPERSYPNIPITTALDYLNASGTLKARTFPEEVRLRAAGKESAAIVADGPITTDGIVGVLNRFVAKRPAVMTVDVCDLLFALSGVRADTLMAPTYYASMGFAVPSAIAACLSYDDRAVLALVGDGAFQMTGNELGTALRFGLKPIVVVMNNGGYGTMRAIDADRACYNIPPWDYVLAARAMGVAGERVTTLKGLAEALERHATTLLPVLIEAVMDRGSCSRSLGKMVASVRSRSVPGLRR